MGQRIGDRQRQADLLLDEGGAEGAGNRLAARKKRQVAALAAFPYQVLLQNVQADIAVLLLKAPYQPRDQGGGRVHGKGDIHNAVFPRVINLPVDGLQLLKDAVGMVQHNDAVFVQLNAFPLAVEQLNF